MLQIENLKKHYGKHFSLDIEDLQISRGQRTALLGNNGAGKTTLLRSTLDLIRLDSGHVRIKGADIRSNASWRALSAAFLDENFLISFLTPLEYFQTIASIRMISEDLLLSRLKELVNFLPETVMYGSKYIRDLSAGNRKKTGIVGAFICRPELLILDEPFVYLDPRSRAVLEQHLIQLNQDKGTTLLISSHDLDNIQRVCQRFLLLEDGLITLDIEAGHDSFQRISDNLKRDQAS